MNFGRYSRTVRNERALRVRDLEVYGSLRNLTGKGTTYYVDAYDGSDANDGLSSEYPKLTMDAAFDLLQSGDTIIFWGKVREQLVTPAQVFDVTVMGAGNRPRHADAAPDPTGGHSAATWAAPASPTATTALCRVIQQGWRFENILFAPHTDYCALEIVRNAAAGDSERDGSHASVVGCRFAAGQDHIQFGKAGSFTEIPHNVEIKDCVFEDATGTAISTDTGLTARRVVIEGCHFRANANHIVAALTASHITNSVLGSFTTSSIDLNGGGGLNIVTMNYLSGAYESTKYRVSNANDEWAGNWNGLAGGITVSDPA